MAKKFNKFGRLKVELTRDMRQNDMKNFPLEYIYEESFEKPSYKVTVDLVEKEFFIDSMGVKWVKEKE